MKRLVHIILILFYSNYFFGQCPEPIGAMVNACGANEGINEIVLFSSGATSGTASNFNVFYGTGTPPSSNVMAGNCATSPSGGSTISGCTIINVTTPSTTIPANATVAFIPSSFNNNYDLSVICGGGTLYVVYINITSGAGCNGTGVTTWQASGTLANQPPAPRYLQVTGPDAGCGTSGSPVLSYSNGWSSNADGNYVSWNSGSPSYSNSGCNIPLKFDLVSFEVNNTGKTNVLKWTTASEKDNEGFEIERSRDGYQFETIGFVAGNLNSSTLQYYQFIDENLVENRYYYRLKAIDKFGNSDFSEIRTVSTKLENKLVIQPSLVTDWLEVSSNSSSNGKIILNDINGATISQIDVESDAPIKLNVSDLVSGLYFVHFVDDIGNFATQKFVKK